VTNRRKPAQRATSTEWKPTRPRAELYKAIGGASAVVLLTALVIFVIKPADTSTSTPSPVPATTPATIPTGPTGSLPTDPTTTPSLPTDSTTTPTQPPDTTSTPTQP